MEDESDTNSSVELIVDATIESLLGTDDDEEQIENTVTTSTANSNGNNKTKVSPAVMKNQLNYKDEKDYYANVRMEDVNDTITLLLESDTETEPPTPDTHQAKNHDHKSTQERMNHSKFTSSGEVQPTNLLVTSTTTSVSPPVGTATSTMTTTIKHKAQPGSLAAIALGVNIRRDSLNGTQGTKRRKVLAAKTVAKMNRIKAVEEKKGALANDCSYRGKILNPKTVCNTGRPKSIEEQAGDSSDNASIRTKKAKKSKFVSESNGTKNSALTKESLSHNEPIIPPQKVYEGPPTRDLPGGWPEGWTEKRYKRMGGTCKGNEDSYWFSPTEPPYKLRSRTEVQRFLYAMDQTNDPKFAYSQRKKGPTEDT